MGKNRNNVDYLFPDTVEEAINIKLHSGDRSFFVAGGTDLLLNLERQQVHPTTLIDLSRISDLGQIVIDSEKISIGSAVTYQQMLAAESFCKTLPLLAEAISTIGGVQVRNVATMAGNIANASPAGDTLPCLYVLNAVVHLTGPEGARQLPIDEFILGVRQTALKPAELITHITFDVPETSTVGVFEKLGLRQAMAIAVASTALSLRFEGNEVAEAHIALGAVAPTVIFAPEAEAALLGHPLNAATIEDAAQKAAAAARPIDDLRASAQYRQMAIRGMVRRALHRCHKQSTQQE